MKVKLKENIIFKAMQWKGNDIEITKFICENTNIKEREIEIDGEYLNINVDDETCYAERFDYVVISDLYCNGLEILSPEMFNKIFEK